MEPRTILVVDNEPNLLVILHCGLSRQGYDVISAKSTQEAHRWLIENDLPDLAIVGDLKPLSDASLSLVVDLRSLCLDRPLPIIMLSTQTRPDQIHDGLAHGADLYLNKPFSTRTLENVVRQLLEISLMA